MAGALRAPVCQFRYDDVLALYLIPNDFIYSIHSTYSFFVIVTSVFLGAAAGHTSCSDRRRCKNPCVYPLGWRRRRVFRSCGSKIHTVPIRTGPAAAVSNRAARNGPSKTSSACPCFPSPLRADDSAGNGRSAAGALRLLPAYAGPCRADGHSAGRHSCSISALPAAP